MFLVSLLSSNVRIYETNNRGRWYERLEMLSLVAPGSGPIAVLYNPTYLPGVGVLRRAQSAADSLGIQLNVVEAQSVPQMDSAFAVFKRNGVPAVLINNHGLFRINAAHLAALSLSYKLPVSSPYPEARDAGTLLSSVPDFVFWSRRAARYIDRILRGANPAQLAVEESVPQHFTVNLKTAAALGIAVSEEAMVRAHTIR